MQSGLTASPSADENRSASSLLRRPERIRAGATRVNETNKLMELSNAVGRVQHEMNNPRAALLAESQLLELDPTLNEEQRDSVRRIVDLARRESASSRKLDALREKED
jgi:hypothetical protein